MKALLMTALLTLGFGTNLMAAADKTCYPFHPNQDGYNRLCVSLENPFADNTKATIEIYRYERMVKEVQGLRVHNEQERVCETTPRPFCHRRYEALRLLSKVQNELELEVFMRVSRRTTCLNGSLKIREQARMIELDVECPRVGWETI